MNNLAEKRNSHKPGRSATSAATAADVQPVPLTIQERKRRYKFIEIIERELKGQDAKYAATRRKLRVLHPLAARALREKNVESAPDMKYDVHIVPEDTVIPVNEKAFGEFLYLSMDLQSVAAQIEVLERIYFYVASAPVDDWDMDAPEIRDAWRGACEAFDKKGL